MIAYPVCEFGSGLDAQLRENLVQVNLYRPLGDTKLIAYVAIAHAARHQLGNRLLPWAHTKAR